MGIGDRHQKKDVEAALKRAERAGLKVTRTGKGHRWGLLICCPCNESHTVACTPQSQGEEARSIDRFTRRHASCA
ncbi:hypothetical protein ACFWPV_28145 [Streptomyces uncialis]|uniref:hypothetical protein n=1 Tax=Streptomyces TaxID=1883 RepID=UPI000C087EA7|nr:MULTISPECIES: hypothetical protein [Streptomyces]MCX4664243.1 hypothetical protein [Streptomyces uncialis]WST70108.1 hypothetical protein OG268_23180 [Streptomyces uncialis]WTE11255.1 hypothetical protein OG924_13845 [Streptomyces uncialis]